MSKDETICGYPLGRFLRSSHSFIVSDTSDTSDTSLRSQESDGSGVIAKDSARPRRLTVHPVAGEVSFDLANRHGATVDVGRKTDGSLVIIETPEFSSFGQRESPRERRVLFQRAECSDSLLETIPAEGDLSGSVSHRLSELRHWVWAAVAPTVRQRRAGLRTRRRPLIIFAAVLLLVSLGMMLAMSSGTSTVDRPTVEPVVAISSQTLVQDPVDFARAETFAGKIPGLVADDAGGDRVEARVISRNGEIVLVEVKTIVAGQTTIATLLLQNSEKGWRTRDVFEAEG